jgi:hypothetical protein
VVNETALLVDKARAAGITLTLEGGGRIGFDAPATPAVAEFLRELQAHDKDELVAALALAALLERFPGAAVVSSTTVGRRFVLAECSVCGRACFVGKRTTPPCRLTPHCLGRHGAKPGTTRKVRQPRAPRQREVKDAEVDPNRRFMA